MVDCFGRFIRQCFFRMARQCTHMDDCFVFFTYFKSTSTGQCQHYQQKINRVNILSRTILQIQNLRQPPHANTHHTFYPLLLLLFAPLSVMKLTVNTHIYWQRSLWRVFFLFRAHNRPDDLLFEFSILTDFFLIVWPR